MTTIVVTLRNGYPEAVKANGCVKVVFTQCDVNECVHPPQVETKPSAELNKEIDTLTNKTAVFTR